MILTVFDEIFTCLLFNDFCALRNEQLSIDKGNEEKCTTAADNTSKMRSKIGLFWRCRSLYYFTLVIKHFLDHLQ